MAPMLRKSGRRLPPALWEGPRRWDEFFFKHLRLRLEESWNINQPTSWTPKKTTKQQCVSKHVPPPNPFFFSAKLSHKKDSPSFSSGWPGKALLFESGGPDTEYVIREAAIGTPPPCVLSIAGWVEKSGGQTHGNSLGRDQEGCPEYLDKWIFGRFCSRFVNLVFFFWGSYIFSFRRFCFDKAQFLGDWKMLVMTCMSLLWWSLEIPAAEMEGSSNGNLEPSAQWHQGAMEHLGWDSQWRVSQGWTSSMCIGKDW